MHLQVFKPTSTWEPPKNHNTIIAFIEALNKNVDELFKHKQTLPRNNISQFGKDIINEFSKREDLFFTKADKGRATVILNVGDYIEKSNKEFKSIHCVKSVQMRSFFWSLFSRIWTEYGDLRSISLYSARMREYRDQKKLRIWALFTQCCHANWKIT